MRTKIVEAKSVELDELTSPASARAPTPVGQDDPFPRGLATSPPVIPPTTGPVLIKQYFSTPKRCLDCTLANAQAQQKHLFERYREVCTELEMRECENAAAFRAISDAAGSNPEGHLNKSQIEELEALDAEADALREKKDNKRNHIQRSIELLWHEVRKEWNGGVREILRADGTGGADEKCVFVFPWETLDFGKAVEQVMCEDIDWDIPIDRVKEEIEILERKWEVEVRWDAVENKGDDKALEDIAEEKLKLED
jgi:hypothetical protein